MVLPPPGRADGLLPSLEDSRDPREQLLAVFDRKPRDTDGPIRGCPFLNAAVEVPDPEHPVHRPAAAYKKEFSRRLAEIARRAGARDPEHLGEQLALLYDGTVARATALNSDGTGASAREIAALLVDAALADPAGQGQRRPGRDPDPSGAARR
ncbi:TetR family transcriptional regulator C-terminal domain-containing protein [Streptomyces wuyuanensis]|uniref:Tetracyclin repressor-like C-terminal domain-containing protein n=1 Tax=Streptomyces wuyuanensis TaxID=1196353 RepID=A0A1G9Z323_9ACTN|nr:hypothetical protein [Streptomyces wuyuanensis]SDN15699.1 hypothetical protein SAMN05444921_120119 [Streptomyces wuyuanensis]